MHRIHTGRHRAVDKVDRLERELAGARLRIDGLRMQLADANAARDRANERANTLAEADVRAERAEAEATALRADLANARSVSAPPGVRDVDPDDQPTAPIDVRPLRAAFEDTFESVHADEDKQADERPDTDDEAGEL